VSLKLYYHPLSSYCHKALIALYERDVGFEPVLVDLSDEKSSATLRSLWPIAKFPVPSRAARDRINAKVMKDKRLAAMTKMKPKDMPFDAKRMIYGGFKTMVTL
jgi:hypothetical protein